MEEYGLMEYLELTELGAGGGRETKNLFGMALSYPGQSWYRDAPLYPLSVCQISRQSDNAFAFYSSFRRCAKRGR